MTPTIERELARVRAGLDRLDPIELRTLGPAALVVDIRPEAHRRREGTIPGAVVVERNELEWRLDPTSPDRLPDVEHRLDRVVVVVCNEGYASSLAAASLRSLGLHRATDLIGGFRAWRRAGLPVDGPVAELVER